MGSPFLGEIIIFGGNFAPRGWALCQGQLMAIAQNTALFSILGTTYGGNGQTTFALPDLRGRVAVGQGQGPGLSSYVLGQQGGVEFVTLSSNQIPAHSHLLNATTGAGTQRDPSGSVLAKEATGQTAVYSNAGSPPTVNTTLAANSIANSGGGQPHDNLQPYLVVNYIICLAGIFPSRN